MKRSFPIFNCGYMPSNFLAWDLADFTEKNVQQIGRSFTL